jgi:hypothetical protein
MVEFNRRSIALLRKIKKIAKDEVGCEIHFDSNTLENDLRVLVRSGVSAELLALVEDFLPSQAPPVELQMQESRKVYRGSEILMDDSPRVRQAKQKMYRGQLVEA